MSSVNKQIAALPGDGIGPEVIHQAVKVLRAVAEKYNYKFDFVRGTIGGEAIERTGTPLPAETIEICEKADAVFLGAVGLPKYDNDPNATVRPEQGLLGIRKALGLYLNIRPIQVFQQMASLSVLKPEIIADASFVIYRELGSGIYFGEKNEWQSSEEGDIVASDLCSYKKSEVERVVIRALKAARKRNGKLCVVDKANVLASSRLWRKVAMNLAEQYPDVDVSYMYVDNAAMQLVLNPAQFDVIVTSNMFGDILSDLGSAIAGSLGMLPSASIGQTSALFEPVQGSYPQAAGKDIANPVATILSGAQMMDYFGLTEAAADIRRSVEECISSGLGTPDMHPEHEVGCAHMGDMIALAVDEGELKKHKASTGAGTII